MAAGLSRSRPWLFCTGFVVFACAPLWGVEASACGQAEPLWLHVAIGRTIDTTDRVAEVEVVVPGASSIRLSLKGTSLAEGALLVIVSASDGAHQTLTAESLTQWAYTSAYFNGDRVVVQLVGSGNVQIDSAWAQLAMSGDDGFGSRSLCGPESRVPTTNAALARMLPSVCTAFLVADANGSFVSAGHCLPAAATVLEFNVPPSDSLGLLVHPSPMDQYVVEPTSVQLALSGAGNDWSYFGVFPNSETGLTPFQAQGERFAIVNAAPPMPGEQVVVTGFGSVAAPADLAMNYALKVDAGPLASLAGSVVRHSADTTDGNSGSPIFSPARNAVVAVHTHGGCSSTGGSNQGTAMQNAGFANARQNPRGVCASGAATGSSELVAAGDLANNIGSLVSGEGDGIGARFAAFGSVAPRIEGLAYDGVNDELWASTADGWLLRLDASTKAETLRGRITGSPFPITGLAFDPSRRVLLGISGADGQLYRIDLVSLVAEPQGSAGGGSIDALDFDPFSRTLFGLDDATGQTRLVRLDQDSGERTVVGALGLGFTDCNGLAFNPADGFLYTVHTPDGRVLRIDAGSGMATSLGTGNGMWDSSVGLAARVLLPTCAADVDFSGAPDSDDVALFFAWWDSGDAAADLTHNSSTDSDDVIAFFQAWDDGCSE